MPPLICYIAIYKKEENLELLITQFNFVVFFFSLLKKMLYNIPCKFLIFVKILSFVYF